MRISATTSLGDYLLETDRCDPYTNAELTITLRIGFRQINPRPGTNGTYNDYGDPTQRARKIIPWSQSSWVAWIKSFVRSAQTYWNGRLWLINNFSEFEFERGTVRYRPNVDCRLFIVGEQAARLSYHHIVDVVKLDPSETWFGSHAKLYDNLDTRPVQKDVDRNGKPIMQLGHVHEIGHLLGLDHVDVGKPHCSVGGDTNAKACYGVDDKDKRSLMGGGISLGQEHGNPWRRAMIQLTGKGKLATTTDWQTMKLHVYPRTLAEVAANRLLPSRPAR